MPSEKENLTEEVKPMAASVLDLLDKLNDELKEKLEDREVQIEKLIDQKKIWQGVAIILATILGFGMYFGSCKSQDFVDRIIQDADISSRVDSSIHLDCKIIKALKLSDPLCVSLGEQPESYAFPESTQTIAEPDIKPPTNELKFIGKGQVTKSEEVESTEEKLTVEQVIEEDAATEDVSSEEDVEEEKPAKSGSSEEDFIDLNKLNQEKE